MNSFELNKVLGAVLGTCLVLLALNIGAHSLFATETPEKPGYKIVVAKAEGGKPAAKEPEIPLPVLLAKADVKKGERIAKQCGACHNFTKGAGAKIGPDLWNVVDRPRHEAQGFKYSAGMMKMGGKWTFKNIFDFIENPRGDIPGTAMTFAGIKSPQQRADVIAYLRTLSDNPVPLPKAEAAATPADAPKAAPMAAPEKK